MGGALRGLCLRGITLTRQRRVDLDPAHLHTRRIDIVDTWGADYPERHVRVNDAPPPSLHLDGGEG